MFTSLFYDSSLESVAPQIAKLGFEAVEIPVWWGSKQLSLEGNYIGHGKSLLTKLESLGLSVPAINNARSGQLVLGPLDESTDSWVPKKYSNDKVKFAIKSMRRAAEAASELEIPIVVGFVGSPQWDKYYIYPPGNADIYERHWQLFADRWGPIFDYFQKLGVRFAAEIHPMEMIYNLETAERALGVLNGHPAFGFNLDPSHLIWQSIDPVVVIKTMKDRIIHVHAKDGEVQEDEVRHSGVIPTGDWKRPNRGFRFRVPGWGQVPWRRVITALAQENYKGVLSYEHEDPIISRYEGCKKAADYLKPLLIHENIDEIWW